MRTRFPLSAFVVAVLGVSSAFAQTNVGVSRLSACTLNPGYDIADVVATARAFEWPEEMAPGLVLIRSGIATTGTAQQFDFVIEAFYPSYAAMVERRLAFLQSQAGTNGRRGLDGLATCSDNTFIRSTRVVAPPPGGPGSIQAVTAAATTQCELNGGTVDDAVALASGLAENLGAAAAVRNGGFGGGQGVPFNSRAGMMFVFPSFADFGTALDQLSQAPPASNPDNPISCAIPSLWASYRIHPLGD